MDSNSKHCPSRASTDNLGDDQKEPGTLSSSCATSSASPPPGSEAGPSRQPSTSCAMEEMTATAGVAEMPAAVGIQASEDCVASSSQTVVERSSSGSPHNRGSDISLALRRSPPCVIKLPTTPAAAAADKRVCSTNNGSSQVPSSSTVPACVTAASGGEQRVKEKENEEALAVSAQKEVESSPRGTKRSHDEVDTTTTTAASPVPVKQKNKKRCFKCSCKLELAQREIGRCRCDRVFCSLHRLPELHGCDFDHKEDGRREAREKMVKPTRHLGNNCRRLDSTHS